ncbi:MAG: hypothetical protein FJZ58_07930 [Chlamydiae bacterium]|nr:hypothetical protein [Chlamydiota bacterium]
MLPNQPAGRGNSLNPSQNQGNRTFNLDSLSDFPPLSVTILSGGGSAGGGSGNTAGKRITCGNTSSPQSIAGLPLSPVEGNKAATAVEKTGDVFRQTTSPTSIVQLKQLTRDAHQTHPTHEIEHIKSCIRDLPPKERCLLGVVIDQAIADEQGAITLLDQLEEFASTHPAPSNRDKNSREFFVGQENTLSGCFLADSEKALMTSLKAAAKSRVARLEAFKEDLNALTKDDLPLFSHVLSEIVVVADYRTPAPQTPPPKQMVPGGAYWRLAVAGDCFQCKQLNEAEKDSPLQKKMETYAAEREAMLSGLTSIQRTMKDIEEKTQLYRTLGTQCRPKDALKEEQTRLSKLIEELDTSRQKEGSPREEGSRRDDLECELNRVNATLFQISQWEMERQSLHGEVRELSKSQPGEQRKQLLNQLNQLEAKYKPEIQENGKKFQKVRRFLADLQLRERALSFGEYSPREDRLSIAIAKL